MKKIVKVVIEQEYEIEIEDKLLTKEFVVDFEKGFWELDGDTVDEKIAGLFKVAAHQIAHGESSFVEGIGPCSSVFTAEYHRKHGREINMVYEELYNETETEIVS